jgi:hypothetical protein
VKITRTIALIAFSTLVLAGCSSSTEPSASPTPSASETEEPKVYVSAPLTGMTYEEGAPETATFNLPSVSCKIDNVLAARPQFNLNKADLVFVQMVEGGVTRLVGVWHSTPVQQVGPVRSVRPMDADTIAPLGGIFCFSGGQLPFVQATTEVAGYMASETSEQGAGKGSFSRSSAKPAPHNVIVNMELLQSQHPDLTPPNPMFQMAAWDAKFESYQDPSTLGGLETLNFEVKYPGATSFWENDSYGNWIRTQDRAAHMDAATSEQIKATNVVVLKVNIDTSFRDGRYGYIPRTVLVDGGTAWVFHNGKRLKGTWSKASQTAPIQLLDENGVPIKLAPGNTWIELMPSSGSITIKSPEAPSPSPSP